MSQFTDAVGSTADMLTLGVYSAGVRVHARTKEMFKQREFQKEHEKFAAKQQKELEVSSAPMVQANVEVNAKQLALDEAKEGYKAAAQSELDDALKRQSGITIRTLTKRAIRFLGQMGHQNPVTAKAAGPQAEATMALLAQINEQSEKDEAGDMKALEERGRMERAGFLSDTEAAKNQTTIARDAEAVRQFNSESEGKQLEKRAELVRYVRLMRSQGRSAEETAEQSRGLLTADQVPGLFDAWEGMSDEYRAEAVSLKGMIAEHNSQKTDPEAPDEDVVKEMKIRLKEVLSLTSAVWKNENDWRKFGMEHGKGKQRIAETIASFNDNVKSALKAALKSMFSPQGRIPQSRAGAASSNRAKAETPDG